MKLCLSLQNTYQGWSLTFNICVDQSFPKIKFVGEKVLELQIITSIIAAI